MLYLSSFCRLVLAVFSLWFPGPGGTAGEETSTFPWALGREYRYSWIRERRKVGETRFRLSEVDAPTGSTVKRLYRSASQYRYEREGISQSGEHEAYFDRSWRPVRYQAHHRYSGLKDYHSRQDHEGEVRDGKLSVVVVHNGITQQPVRSELDVPPDGYLFLNQALDEWAILAGNLLHRPSTYDAKVIYPDFLRVYDVRFIFEKEEPVDLGKKEKPLGWLFSFRSREGQLEGKVWVDKTGRMLQYQQGDLRIYLEE